MNYGFSNYISVGGERRGQDFQFSAEDAILAEIPVAGDASNVERALTINVAGLKAIMFYADQDLTLSLNAASGDTPDQTLDLTAGIPCAPWVEGNGLPCSIDQDVTSIFITNDSDPNTATTLFVIGGQDLAPS